jgi:hypothetical protein
MAPRQESPMWKCSKSAFTDSDKNPINKTRSPIVQLNIVTMAPRLESPMWKCSKSAFTDSVKNLVKDTVIHGTTMYCNTGSQIGIAEVLSALYGTCINPC